jgi:hypothetical protein
MMQHKPKSIALKCPYCKGILTAYPKVKPPNQDYICQRCGRGWIIDNDGNWLALYDAGGHVYNSAGQLVAWIGATPSIGQDAQRFYNKPEIKARLRQ